MENTLETLFDFQKFLGNERLARVINETGQTCRELSLEELGLVSAAGDKASKMQQMARIAPVTRVTRRKGKMPESV